MRFPGGGCLGTGRGRLPRRGPGRDGGSDGRGSPGEAAPAGSAELLHLQPALRAARGRGERGGAGRSAGGRGGGRRAAGRRRARGAAGGSRAVTLAPPAPGSTCHSALLQRQDRGCEVPGVRPGPGVGGDLTAQAAGFGSRVVPVR